MAVLSDHEVLRLLRQVDGDRVVLETRHRGVRATTRVLLHPIDPRLDALVRAVVTTGRGSVVGLPPPVMEVLEGYRVRLLLGHQPWLPDVVAAGVVTEAPFEVGEQPPTGRGFLFITTRWMEGATLDARWPELGEGARIDMAGRVAERLAVLHEARVAFGDLKPSNVVWGGGEVRLIDLDTLREVPGVDLGVRTTAATQEYAAPEQLHRRETYLASDVWAFGEMLSRLATGRGERAPGPFWGPLIYRCRHGVPSARPRAADLARYLLEGVPLPEDDLMVPVADVVEVVEEPVPVRRPKRTAPPAPVEPADDEEHVEPYVFEGPRPWVSRGTLLSAAVMVMALAVLGWTLVERERRKTQACEAVGKGWTAAEATGEIARTFADLSAELELCDNAVSRSIKLLRVAWPPLASSEVQPQLAEQVPGDGAGGAGALARFTIAAGRCLRSKTLDSCGDAVRPKEPIRGAWEDSAVEVRYEVLGFLPAQEVRDAFGPELKAAMAAQGTSSRVRVALLAIASNAGTNSDYLRLAAQIPDPTPAEEDVLFREAGRRCGAMVAAGGVESIRAFELCSPFLRTVPDFVGLADAVLEAEYRGIEAARSLLDPIYQYCLERAPSEKADVRGATACKRVAERLPTLFALIDLATVVRGRGGVFGFDQDLRLACLRAQFPKTTGLDFDGQLTCARVSDLPRRVAWARSWLTSDTDINIAVQVYSSILEECPDVQTAADSLLPAMRSGDPWCAVAIGRHLGCVVPLPTQVDGCVCETTSRQLWPPAKRIVATVPPKGGCAAAQRDGERCKDNEVPAHGGVWDALPPLAPPCVVDAPEEDRD